MRKTTFRSRLKRYNILQRFFRDPITKKIRRHTLKRIFNLFLVFLSRRIKSPYVLGYPYNIIIEPTNICTLSCPLCPSGNQMMKRKRGMMKYEDFKKIIDQTGDFLYQIGLMNYGESLLNPQLFQMIEYANKHNISTILSTNAQFLNQENAKKLVHSGLDLLSISLDGASPQTYVQYRVKGDFEKTLENIRYLVEKRNEWKSDLFIDLGFLVMKHNEKEIDKAKKLALDLGVDNFSLVKLSLIDYREIPLDEALKFLPEQEIYSRYKIVRGKLELNRKEKKNNTCIWAWDRMVINWDGSVCPCCVDYDCQYYMGNFFETGWKKIWNNERYINLRKQILKNKNKLRVCSNCSASIED